MGPLLCSPVVAWMDNLSLVARNKRILGSKNKIKDWAIVQNVALAIDIKVLKLG